MALRNINMKRTAFAKPGTNEQFIDMRETPVCPDGFVPAQSERPEGDNWIADSDGNWVESVATEDDLARCERQWAMSELALTDRCLTPDFPITNEQQTQVTQYRQSLRNPERENHPDYPEQSWRPHWPEGVKRPAG